MEEEEATLSYLGLKVNRQEAIANSGYDKGHKTEPDGGNLQDIDNGDLQPVVAFTSWSEVTILVDSCKKSIGKIAKNARVVVVVRSLGRLHILVPILQSPPT